MKIDLRLAVIPAVFGIGCLVGSFFPHQQAIADEKSGKPGRFALLSAEYEDFDGKTRKGVFRINSETGETRQYSAGGVSKDGTTMFSDSWYDPIPEQVETTVLKKK